MLLKFLVLFQLEVVGSLQKVAYALDDKVPRVGLDLVVELLYTVLLVVLVKLSNVVKFVNDTLANEKLVAFRTALDS